MRRAWVFQERRMSSRMVHFTNAQLVWECRRCVNGEDGTIVHKGLVEDETRPSNADDYMSRIAVWQQTVTEYSGLELSFEKDRLPAIAAIVMEELRFRPADTYIAGMWKQTLLHDLLWWRYPPSQHMPDLGGRPDRSCPSWSWASVKGLVFYDTFLPLASFQIVDVSFTPKGPLHMGGYHEAAIILKGPLDEAFLGPYVHWSRFRQMQGRRASDSGVGAYGTFADFDFLNGMMSPSPEEKFFFLFVGTNEDGRCYGLVLKQRHGSDFERVGLCYCSGLRESDSSGRQPFELQPSVKTYFDNLPVQEVRVL